MQEIDFMEVGSAADPLGPGDRPNRTFDVVPHAEAPDLDDSGWTVLAPSETLRRLGTGRVCFAWYRTRITLPERIGEVDVTGCTVVFEVVVDDYAEVWVDGTLPVALGTPGGRVVTGFNAPNRVVLTSDARPGQTFSIAVFGINGPISASPRNYIWLRTAVLDVFPPGVLPPAERSDVDVVSFGPAAGDLLAAGARLERVATGLEFTEGPVWAADGALLFSTPSSNQIYRWAPDGTLAVFLSHSGYTGADIGRFAQPGSNGLAFDPQGRLTICQHGNRRVVRVEPHGNITVLADSCDGRRLNSPNDLVYRSDGTLFVTDPPFGLPGGADDPGRELPFSGVLAVRDGEVSVLDDSLAGPNGIVLSPDERYLYVGNWDPAHKVVVRYLLEPGDGVAGREVVADLTDAEGDDAIDGMAVDERGRLYVCGPGGIWVLSGQGERLALLRLPEAPHNLAWGDHDGRTLYVTA
ncbi:MAG: SMP-30/gluconolactonase/LRE family protein, partial [Actinomycetota bacterium]